MAEVTRVLGNLQLDTEGGLVPASGKGLLRSIPSRRRSRLVKDGAKVVKDDPAAGGATKAVGCFTGEIGVTKADAGSKNKAGSVTQAVVRNKEAVVRNKEAAGGLTGEIGVTEADQGNKEAGEIGVTEAEAGNKEAAGKGVVTEAAWIEFVFPKTPVELLERKAEPTGALITKEMVPDVIIDRLKMKRRPFPKLPRILHNDSGVYDRFPDLRDLHLATVDRWNYLVDLHVDVLEQDADKGFAEVGVDFTDGVKKLFILPRPAQGCAP